MTPEVCFTAAVVAYIIDYWGLGQNAIGDRVSFFLYLAAWSGGLAGTGFAAGAVGVINTITASLATSGQYAPILVGAQRTGSSLLALALVVWTFFCLLPTRYSSRFGRAAHLSFRKSGGGGGEREGGMRGGGGGGGSNHINWRLLWASVADATIAPLLLKGLFGSLVAGIISIDSNLVSAAIGAFLHIGQGL